MEIPEKRLRFVFNEFIEMYRDIKGWEELPATQQAYLSSALQLNEGELPMVAFVDGPMPIVLSPRRLIWQAQGKACSILFAEMNDINAPDRFHVFKSDLCRLRIVTDKGEEHLLETKPGSSLFALWNLLLKLSHLSYVYSKK
ncbi:MAG TPA: hypothetical protein VKZ53_13325 [Candidatus Angelobacter sp.]|nr:hypothetical protein [Candidatus Angelobacter sp.]